MTRWQIIEGDCVEVMREMPEASADAVVCDPPYMIGFMALEFDRQDRAHTDPSRMQAWHETWAREALRMLKPGGHLVAFGGTRTFHRLACAIEDAGFEIRDCIGYLAWVQAQGFPKSLNLGDGLGTALKPAWEALICAHRPLVALEPITLARKPLDGTIAANVAKHGTGALRIDDCRIGVGAGGGRDGEASARARYTERGSTDFAATPGPRGGDARGRWPSNVVLSHSPNCEMVGTKRVAQGGGVPQTSENRGMFGIGHGEVYGDADGTEEVEDWRCQPECAIRLLDEQSGGRGGKVRGTEPSWTGDNGIYGTFARVENAPYLDRGGASRFFYVAKASRAEREEGLASLPGRTTIDTVGRDADSRGAQSPRAGAGRGAGALRYRCARCGIDLSGGRAVSSCAIGDRHEPVACGRGPTVRNLHPTVKPIALLRWLHRLVCPPGGVILDPFAGSGSGGVAARMDGLRWIGIEREPDYVAIARARIAAVDPLLDNARAGGAT